MKLTTEQIYQRQAKKKKHLLSLKNEYFAIIYKGRLNGDSVRKIHKALYDATINKKPQYRDKYLLGFAIKMSNRASKISAAGLDLLAIALFDLIKTGKYNDKAKKLISDGKIKYIIGENKMSKTLVLAEKPSVAKDIFSLTVRVCPGAHTCAGDLGMLFLDYLRQWLFRNIPAIPS